MSSVEIPLEGGNVTAGVVRVGDTVRRPRKPGSDLAHAVLRHLEEVGFDHAPRFLGIDDQGREILTFAPGRTISPELVADGAPLAPIGALVRSLHDAMTTFEHGSDDGTIVLHGDLGPWNVVVGDDDAWTIIDWDAVAPGRPAWDLAYVLQTFVPLWSNSPFADDDAEIVRRIGVLLDAYGADAALRHEALGLVPDKCRWIADWVEEMALAGDAALRKLVDEGHPQIWREAADRARSRLPRWSPS